jgi:hypothetical protein
VRRADAQRARGGEPHATLGAGRQLRLDRREAVGAVDPAIAAFDEVVEVHVALTVPGSCRVGRREPNNEDPDGLSSMTQA